AADLQPEQGRIFIHEVVRMPEPPWEDAPYAPGHAQMARCTPMTHAIVSIQGDVGVPEQECREAVEGLAAHMIAETMRFHGGCAVFADRGPTFEFTVAVLKQPVRAVERAPEDREAEAIRTS
ncbi:MAG: hypothetical protein K8I02_05480, partial [Candidatus Methylomirabilis sp.]|nr:hypothetical protein [Deltaproteobacteria bacterium]